MTIRDVAVFCAAAAAAGTWANAQTAYNNSAEFLDALAGEAVVTEDFESAEFGQVIPSGSVFGGLVYNFNLVGPAEGGLVASTYAVIDFQGLFVERDGEPGPGPADYFYLPESVTVTFPAPVKAVGVYFNIGFDFLQTDYAYVSTAVGTATTGGDHNPEQLYPWMFFAGIISETPLTTATFGATEFAPSGWNADNLTYVFADGAGCYADFTGDGILNLFDFLAFVSEYNGQSLAADCDESGTLNLFDFLCFTSAFNEGC